MKTSFINIKFLLLIGLLLPLTSCVDLSKKESYPTTFKGIELTDVYSCDCDIRALQVNDEHIFYAASKGQFGYLNSADNSVEYTGEIESDGEKPEFRGNVKTKSADFIMSSGSPALLYRTDYFGKRKKIFKQTDEDAFLDAIAFWDDKNGIMIGDPMEDCMAFYLTDNEGENWRPISCSNLPELEEGEVAFAASNSNIVTKGKKGWVLSGGKTSRVYYTPNKGKRWRVFETPLISGKETTGGYTMDFYNERIGIIMGGDYTEPKRNKANKAITTNGGKTWELVADGENPGYTSSVKFIPNSGGKEIVSAGPSGIYYSHDFGENWNHLSEESFHTIQFLNDFTAYAAGKNKIVQITFIEDTNE